MKELSLSQAKREISIAATKAVQNIATAADKAAKIIIDAASTSVVKSETKSDADHDLLIELKSKMEDLKSDIKKLNDGTATNISDHEIRIRALEQFRWLLTGGLVLLQALEGIALYILLKK